MHKVLLADDHDLVRETIAAYLRQQTDLIITTAKSFDEVLDMCLSGATFDLILLDYSMPGMNDLGGLKKIKDFPGNPVAILSGTATPDVARRAIKSGAAGFCPKPFHRNP